MASVQMVQAVCEAAAAAGFTVYISKTRQYGMYTDGKRCVSFGGQWSFCIDFNGNYSSKYHGTGWGIVRDHGIPTAEELHKWIKLTAPHWATDGFTVKLTTPDLYLSMYTSSGFTEYQPEHKPEAAE